MNVLRCARIFGLLIALHLYGGVAQQVNLTESRYDWLWQWLSTTVGPYAKAIVQRKNMGCRRGTILNSIGIHFCSYDESDSVLMREVFTQTSKYGIEGVQRCKAPLVVDVGANAGAFAVLAAKANPRVRIVAVEPVWMNLFILRLNLFLNNITEITSMSDARHRGGVMIVPSLLTSDGRDVQLRYPDDLTAASEAEYSSHSNTIARLRDEKLGSAIKATPTPSLAVKDFWSTYVREELCFLKIDCEGCEYDVLPIAWEAGLLPPSVRLAGEFHPFWPRSAGIEGVLRAMRAVKQLNAVSFFHGLGRTRDARGEQLCIMAGADTFCRPM